MGNSTQHTHVSELITAASTCAPNDGDSIYTSLSKRPPMELGSHLAAKLEPFVLISKSAKGAAAVKLIQDVISAQGVYFFAELLDSPNIKEVRQLNRPTPLLII